MKIDAHYYAVLTFSRACGFDRRSARTLAHASQFVDDAKINSALLYTDRPRKEMKYEID